MKEINTTMPVDTNKINKETWDRHNFNEKRSTGNKISNNISQ